MRRMQPSGRQILSSFSAAAVACALALGTTACAQSSASAGSSSQFRPMPIGATVFLRLDCSLGSVRFVGVAVSDSDSLDCPPTPQLVKFSVPFGEYRLAFRDSNEDRRWSQWLFTAQPGGAAVYWGDISILPGLARVERNEDTLRRIEREMKGRVLIGVSESR